MTRFALFGRSFVQVSLVAFNVAMIAKGHMAWAFVLACSINYLWFTNVQRAAGAEMPNAAVFYALGAGCGTVAAMLLSRFF